MCSERLTTTWSARLSAAIRPPSYPTIAIVSNRPHDVPDSYERYLVHGFREAWAFTGSPLRLKFTARGSKR